MSKQGRRQCKTVLEVGALVACVDGRACRFHSQKDARGDEEEECSQERFETGAQLLPMSVVERVLIRHDKLYWVELPEFAAVTSTLISRLRSKKRRPIGLGKGLIHIPPSFFDPLPQEILDAFEGKS